MARIVNKIFVSIIIKTYTCMCLTYGSYVYCWMLSVICYQVSSQSCVLTTATVVRHVRIRRESFFLLAPPILTTRPSIRQWRRRAGGHVLYSLELSSVYTVSVLPVLSRSGRVPEFQDVLSRETIDINRLRELCFQGNCTTEWRRFSTNLTVLNHLHVLCSITVGNILCTITTFRLSASECWTSTVVLPLTL